MQTTFNHLGFAALLLIAVQVAGCNCKYISSSRCLDLDGQIIGTSLNVGDVFTANRVSIEIQSESSTGSGGGTARFISGNQAGGTGSELALENAVVEFMLPYPVNSVTVKFRAGDSGEEVQINGNRQPVQDLGDLNRRTIEGVAISVSGGGPTAGLLSLTGTITDFRIGGENLRIDDVCYEQ